MAHRSVITIRLDQFEGPLDLLLYLIQSHELDISTVSISKITDPYVQALLTAQELDFDIASEFLVMAATLILWKSRSLLPKEEVATDGEVEAPFTQEDLVRRLLERQRFLAASQELSQQPFLGDDVFTRANQKPPVEKIWKEMNPTNVAMSYHDMIVRQRRRKTVLKKETVSVSEKIRDYATKLPIGETVEMRQTMSERPERGEWVVSLLASLELAKLKKLQVFQNQAYEAIFLKLLSSLADIGTDYKTEFDKLEHTPVEARQP